MDILLVLALKAIAYITAAAAVLILHMRIRNSASKWLLASACALVLYQLAYIATDAQLANYVAMNFPQHLALAYVATNHVLPGLLWLVASVALLMCAKSLARPNNSSKPTPLRGVGKVS